MVQRSGISRWCFRIVCGLAILLVVLVMAAPLFDAGEEAPEGWRQLVVLFARDAALRRTCLASATGLLVTACVFFQQTVTISSGQSPTARPKRSNVAGA